MVYTTSCLHADYKRLLPLGTGRAVFGICGFGRFIHEATPHTYHRTWYNTTLVPTCCQCLLMNERWYMYMYVCCSCVADVNVAFQQAMMKIGIDHEELTKQFKLVVNAPLSELGKVSAISRRKSCSWKHIGMTHAVSWPLHVVFTPTALKRCVVRYVVPLYACTCMY